MLFSIMFAWAEIAKSDLKHVFKMTKELPTIAFGDPKAKLRIDMYYSLTCTHCAEFRSKVFPKIKTQYIDKGLVYFVTHDYPVDDLATKAHMVAWCQGAQNYQKNALLLLKNQDKWFGSKVEFTQIATQANLPAEDVAKCAANKELEDQILQERVSADMKYEPLQWIPFFVINGKATDKMVDEKVIADFLNPKAQIKKDSGASQKDMQNEKSEVVDLPIDQ